MEINKDVLISIRKFSLQDLTRVLEIENSSFASDAFSENTFRDLYHNCSGLFIVADVYKIITGYMVTCSYVKKAKVISIAVDPAYRCRGIGSALVNFTFSQLKTFLIRAVDLEVRITNKVGINFWKSFGFYPLKIMSNYYLDGTNAIVMRKSLP